MKRKKLGRRAKPEAKRGQRRSSWTGFRGKTFWDVLQLLGVLAIPVVIAVGGCMFNAQQNTRQNELEEQRSDREQAIEEQRAQDAALQAYLDHMSDLLIHEHGTQLRKLDSDAEVIKLIRARSRAVLDLLDTGRQRTVVAFLAAADLSLAEDPIVNFAKANLRNIDLRGIDLSNTNFASADLTAANLARVDLSSSDLQDTNLANANLLDANLTGVNLDGANLSGTNLAGANLTRAVVTDEQLDAARSLRGATMPDGSKHP